ncbi:MAG: DUF1772 domain-containing protein [Acidimicrobiia bacterium]|nr:DUF1772 domain-containing protein [Acidimicrobiia bacterium]
MPGLAGTDDRPFVGAFQAIDSRIINPLFLGTFFGGLFFTVLSAILHLGDEWSSVLPWLIVAAVVYLAVVVLTAAINVPLNDAIKAAGTPDEIDVAQVRSDFNEARWVRSNLPRAVLTLGAFMCLIVALIEHGRISG